MLLTEMDDVSIKDSYVLQNAGYRTLQDWADNPPKASVMRELLGWEVDKFIQFHRGVILVVKVKGVSTSNLRALNASKVRDIHSLSIADASSLHDSILLNRAGLTKVPSLGQVKDWVDQAQQIMLED